MIYLLYTVHIVVCLFLILVVLLQQGKGADLSVFGGGATQAAFGSRGAASLLHKLTVWSFVAFIFTTVSISFATTSGNRSSVLSDVPVAEESEATEARPAPEQPDQTQPAESQPAESPPAESPSGDDSAAATTTGDESPGEAGAGGDQSGEDGSDG